MKVLIEAQTWWAIGLAVILAVNTAIAAYYYLNIAKTMWFDEVPDGDTTPIPIPPSLRTALAITLVATFVFGVLPGLLTDAASVAPVVAFGG